MNRRSGRRTGRDPQTELQWETVRYAREQRHLLADVRRQRWGVTAMVFVLALTGVWVLASGDRAAGVSLLVAAGTLAGGLALKGSG